MISMIDFKVTALAGGIGAARFLQGLVRVMNPGKLTVIVNTADDIEFFGLHISPDIDIVIYSLAGVVNPETGWGFSNDRFACLGQLREFQYEDWFHLGDRDFATHIHRTWLLRQGRTLTQITDTIRKRFSLGPRILPMTNDSVATKIGTDKGVFHFQEYLVKRKTRDRVRKVRFAGIKKARPTREVLESIRQADGIIICPSNPIVSIGPILALTGVREALRKTRARILAISPIVAGKPIKGPAAKIMSGLGMKVSATQVARIYQDFLDVFILDQADRKLEKEVRSLGCRVVVTDTIMKNLRSKIHLAGVACRTLKSPT
jgi:LPPG:FO 2-phospho-L-lactate transferase